MRLASRLLQTRAKPLRRAVSLAVRATANAAAAGANRTAVAAAATARSTPAAGARAFHSAKPAASVVLVQHRDTPENNPQTPFAWSEESKKKIAFVLNKFPAHYRKSAIIPLLYIAQEQDANWLPLTAMNAIAEVLGCAPIRVYEVATFYTMFNRTPVGKYHLQVCGTTPCQLCGFESIRDAISAHLGIGVGETTKDGLFTLAEVECLGACVNAPMMQVNNQHFYEFLTPDNTVKLLDQLKAAATTGAPMPKVNNQNQVFSCEGPQGQTTLKPGTFTAAPFSRDFAALKAEDEKKKAEAAAKAKADAAAKAAAGAAAKP